MVSGVCVLLLMEMYVLNLRILKPKANCEFSPTGA